MLRLLRGSGRHGGGNVYYGPFASRSAAEKFASDSLDFFKMRRCVDDLHPDPQFPGCIYSEMKMCLAPCFKGCSDDEYRGEVARVQAYLDTKGESLVREISAQRDAASAKLDFENASGLHARLEKLKPVLSQRPEIVNRIDRLAGVMVQRSANPESVNLFSIEAGLISGPVTFPIQSSEHAKSQSMESRLQQTLESFPDATPTTALETMEHLVLLKRWYYRSSRIGEIFFSDNKGELPMRRWCAALRECIAEKNQSPMPRLSWTLPASQMNPQPSKGTTKYERRSQGQGAAPACA